MTENEAIEIVKRLVGISPSERIVRAVNMAISALEEIQKCRAIGIAEKCREAVNDLKTKDNYIKQILRERDIAIQQLEEIDVSLGEKMDSVKEAKEKQGAKKVKNRKLLRDFHNRPYSVRGDCPNCGSERLLSTSTDYCNACGQKLDWSDAT